MRCASYCTGTAYDIKRIFETWQASAVTSHLYSEVVFISLEKERTMCFFAYGSVVFWNHTTEEEKGVLAKIANFVTSPLSNIQEDVFTYNYGNETLIEEEEDHIILQSNDPLLKISLSYGLSQSVKLSNFEYEIDQTIQRTRHLPAELAEKGKISLSRKKISQHLGKLFSQKNSINLDSYALDTPEFFWKRPRYEPFYQQAVDFLDIEVRLNILNGKLNLVHELYQILSDELKHAHSSFLEWIIIVLILFEVIISLR
ncbi:MAG: RMD1 family protein [Proteobacteria bacterium]|nr:RMD1 family protein [Pseudomonadota bacterium]